MKRFLHCIKADITPLISKNFICERQGLRKSMNARAHLLRKLRYVLFDNNVNNSTRYDDDLYDSLSFEILLGCF